MNTNEVKGHTFVLVGAIAGVWFNPRFTTFTTPYGCRTSVDTVNVSDITVPDAHRNYSSLHDARMAYESLLAQGFKRDRELEKFYNAD